MRNGEMLTDPQNSDRLPATARSYREIGKSLKIPPKSAYKAERRALYKLLLLFLEGFDCDFERAAIYLDIREEELMEIFVRLYRLYHNYKGGK